MNDEQLVQQPKHASSSTKFAFIASVIVMFAAAILVVFALIGAVQNNKQQATLDDQTAKTNQLISEVKSLTEQNQKTSQQAANYAYCNAVLLAQYTRTLTPIMIQDLNSCVLNSFPNSTVTSPNGKTQSTTNTMTNNTSNSTQTSTSTTTPSGQNQTQTQTQTNPTATVTPQGIGVKLPCVNALGLLQIGCTQ